MTGRPEPFSKESFKAFWSLQTRWADNDFYGHMNNAVHYQLFDTAINAWLIDRGMLDLDSGEIVGLVVETGCSYFEELAFPQSLEAGISVKRIGNSSVEFCIALFAEGTLRAAAQGKFVHVYVDRKTRRPVSLPGDWRVELEKIKHDQDR